MKKPWMEISTFLVHEYEEFKASGHGKFDETHETFQQYLADMLEQTFEEGRETEKAGLLVALEIAKELSGVVEMDRIQSVLSIDLENFPYLVLVKLHEDLQSLSSDLREAACQHSIEHHIQDEADCIRQAEELEDYMLIVRTFVFKRYHVDNLYSLIREKKN